MSSWLDGLATAVARRTSRRGFLARTAVVGAAVAMDPVNYVLRPASAYSSVCGDGASCSSGWTAFCVTINKGVNQCPPGSFTAGWWKADHASVCGGSARYYIDCNASCVGGHRGHYTCGCRCAPGGTCDQRHVCCNQFRYGQCNQQISCYGPVVCRVISCVPPWQWAPCSRSAATDNRTLNHSAPALPHTYDAIERRYVALHGHASRLGASVGGRHAVAGGLLQSYQHGLLAWSPHTPAAMLLSTAAAYQHFGGPGGALGFPTHDERLTHDGQAHLAQLHAGLVYVAGPVAVHAMSGPWLAKWQALVEDMAIAGRPRSDVKTPSDGQGRYGLFDHGSMLWSPRTGAFAVTGAASGRYDTLGRERSALGYPTSDTAGAADGQGTLTSFEHGVIAVGPATGAWDLLAPVSSYWLGAGGVTGRFGYPASAVGAAAVTGAQVAHFQGGLVYTSPAGTFGVTAPILATYQQDGADGGSLGLPTAEATTNGSQTVQTFQGGTISYDASTGTGSISPS